MLIKAIQAKWFLPTSMVIREIALRRVVVGKKLQFKGTSFFRCHISVHAPDRLAYWLQARIITVDSSEVHETV